MRNCSVLFILNWIFIWPFVLPQGCDPNSSSAQCPAERFCRDNYCETALRCDTSGDCITKRGTVCVADYCQHEECTASGQCVHGQVCSKDTIRKCVYHVTLIAEENNLAWLTFPKPGTEGKYEEIAWFKEASGSLQSRIAFVHPDATKGKPYYYNEYCSETSPCETSKKGKLDLDTGTLTINKVQLSDEGYYYYRFYNDGGNITDTGIKHEISLEVYVTPKPKDLLLEGITENVRVGDFLYLSCIINRIRPKAAEIYWNIKGSRLDGTIATESNNRTSRQRSLIQYTVTEEDDGKPIQCVVVPQFGNQVEIQKILTMAFRPGDTHHGGNNVEDNNVGVIIGVVVAIIIIVIIIAVMIFFYKKYGKDYKLCVYLTFSKNGQNKTLKKKSTPVITVANNPGYVNSNEYELNEDAGAGTSFDTDADAATNASVVLQVQEEATNTPNVEPMESVNIERADKEEEDKSVENTSYVNTIDKCTRHEDESVDIDDEIKEDGSSKTENEQVELNIRPNHEYDEVYERQKNEEVRNKTIPHQTYDEVCIEKPEDANHSVHENSEDTNSNTDSHSVEIHEIGNDVKENHGCLNSEPRPQEDIDCYADVEAPSPSSTTEKEKSPIADEIQWKVNILYDSEC